MKRNLYTLEQDLEIIKKPHLDIERFHRVGNYLSSKEIKLIENYIEINGCNAFLKFNKKKKFDRLEIFPLDTASQISTSKESLKGEAKREKNTKDLMEFILNDPYFEIQPISPKEFSHFCRYMDEYYQRQRSKFQEFFPIAIQLYLKEVVNDAKAKKVLEMRVRKSFDKFLKQQEEGMEKARYKKSPQLSEANHHEVESESYRTSKKGIIAEFVREYNISVEEIISLLDKVSYDYQDFILAIKKTQNILWMDFEDSILRGTDEENPLFKRLVSYKGETRVRRRIEYLGIRKVGN